jgi:hypothetical protein
MHRLILRPNRRRYHHHEKQYPKTYKHNFQITPKPAPVNLQQIVPCLASTPMSRRDI